MRTSSFTDEQQLLIGQTVVFARLNLQTVTSALATLRKVHNLTMSAPTALRYEQDYISKGVQLTKKKSKELVSSK